MKMMSQVWMEPCPVWVMSFCLEDNRTQIYPESTPCKDTEKNDHQKRGYRRSQNLASNFQPETRYSVPWLELRTSLSVLLSLVLRVNTRQLTARSNSRSRESVPSSSSAGQQRVDPLCRVHSNPSPHELLSFRLEQAPGSVICTGPHTDTQASTRLNRNLQQRAAYPWHVLS